MRLGVRSPTNSGGRPRESATCARAPGPGDAPERTGDSAGRSPARWRARFAPVLDARTPPVVRRRGHQAFERHLDAHVAAPAPPPAKGATSAPPHVAASATQSRCELRQPEPYPSHRSKPPQASAGIKEPRACARVGKRKNEPRNRAARCRPRAASRVLPGQFRVANGG